LIAKQAVNVLALAGGVGGAKLAFGLAQLVPAGRLTVVVNTGDDAEFHTLRVSPDLDTVMYTLAGIANPETGWGLKSESFNALESLEQLGAETWFRLGDRDLATHLRRTELLRSGWSLSEVTAELCRRLGVSTIVAPMSDQDVRTIAETDEESLDFQDYFVRRRCEPVVRAIRFEGAAEAEPSPAFDAALDAASLLVICPSNPFVSIDPILSVRGVRRRIQSFSGLRIAVSPIIGGAAVKGPAAKMMSELGEEVSAIAVACRYRGLCDIFVLDSCDASLAQGVRALGMQPLVTQTLMQTDDDKQRLAAVILQVTEAK
jgi:LPPG:FO 2-phospho-L-lactate transferase